EHPDVERAGRLVLLDVLAVILVALDEIPLAPAEPSRPTKTDLHLFRDHLTPEFPRSASAHPVSFARYQPRTPYSLTLFWTMARDCPAPISRSRRGIPLYIGAHPGRFGTSSGRHAIAPAHRPRTESRAVAVRLAHDWSPERLRKPLASPTSRCDAHGPLS